MTDWLFVAVIIFLVFFLIGMLVLNNHYMSLKDEAILQIDENFKCNEAHILFLEAEYQAVKDHIVTKVFKECLT